MTNAWGTVINMLSWSIINWINWCSPPVWYLALSVGPDVLDLFTLDHFASHSLDCISQWCPCMYMYKYIFVYYITVTTFKYVKGGPDREAQELV
jgi:hypothetical protein